MYLTFLNHRHIMLHAGMHGQPTGTPQSCALQPNAQPPRSIRSCICNLHTTLQSLHGPPAPRSVPPAKSCLSSTAVALNYMSGACVRNTRSRTSEESPTSSPAALGRVLSPRVSQELGTGCARNSGAPAACVIRNGKSIHRARSRPAMPLKCTQHNCSDCGSLLAQRASYYPYMSPARSPFHPARAPTALFGRISISPSQPPRALVTPSPPAAPGCCARPGPHSTAPPPRSRTSAGWTP